MPLMDLLEEVWAVTPQECAEAELSDETTGEIIASVESFHTKQCVALYCSKQKEFMRICAQMEPYEESNLPAELAVRYHIIHLELKALWEMLSFDIEVKFGHLITQSEREEGYTWDIRAGWRIWKSPDDQQPERSKKVSEVKRRAMMI